MPGFELIGKEEKKQLSKLIDDGGVLFAHGFEKKRKNFHIREFEKQIAKKFKVKFCLAVSSGTAAIKIALKALGVKPGDEVITQAFNFIATIEAILDCGAKPVVVNVNNTLNMDPNELKKKITKKTKVIAPVHMLGVSCEMDEIFKIASKHKIPVLEDNCESVGGKYKKKYLGTMAEAGIFSLDYGKFITTGEGGLILTNDKKIIKYCREYHDHGHENNPKLPRGRDTKNIFGFNYRMTEMQGAIGKVQLKRVNYLLKENKSRYLSISKSLKNVVKIRSIPKFSIPNYDTFIFFEQDKIVRKKIINLLIKEEIGTKNLPDAIEWHCSFFWDQVFSKKERNKFLKTKNLLNTAIAIPIMLKHSPSKYKKISNEIKKIYEN
ncbi:aminotransferase class I/II-fold pyridoxal phosphate-dependent enzyme [Candidatus Pelagibacter sp.]|nr:aminotransferase class I/II-fold pyridoxal phosphate-dependent enzyme [Candidatus Pelagibacter sp.]